MWQLVLSKAGTSWVAEGVCRQPPFSKLTFFLFDKFFVRHRSSSSTTSLRQKDWTCSQEEWPCTVPQVFVSFTQLFWTSLTVLHQTYPSGEAAATVREDLWTQKRWRRWRNWRRGWSATFPLSSTLIQVTSTIPRLQLHKWMRVFWENMLHFSFPAGASSGVSDKCCFLHGRHLWDPGRIQLLEGLLCTTAENCWRLQISGCIYEQWRNRCGKVPRRRENSWRMRWIGTSLQGFILPPTSSQSCPRIQHWQNLSIFP